MENEKLNRINALARLAKERALTAEELAERDALRKVGCFLWQICSFVRSVGNRTT